VGKPFGSMSRVGSVIKEFLISDYPQLLSRGTNREHTAVSV